MYHSALQNFNQWKGEPCSSFLSANIKAFQHDLFNGLHPNMNSCDFFYSDLPWRQGFDVFNKRADYQTDKKWEDLIALTYENIIKSGKPTYLTGGKQMMKLLPKAKVKDIIFKVHNNKDLLFVLNTDEMTKAEDTDTLINELYIKHEVGGDFACGYGLLADFAVRNNKKAILSDYNPYCIGYIKEKYENL